MASITLTVTGDDDLRRTVRNMNPETNPKFVRSALTKGGLLIQRNAARKQIIPGGKAPPAKKRLTSRTGTGRRSIRVDRSGLSRFYVDIGSDLEYMKLHEIGGTVQRRQHARRTKSGNLAAVTAHSATFPARPYLAPALDAVNDELEQLFFEAWDREARK